MKSKQNYDQRHGSLKQDMPKLAPGDKVWITDKEMPGTVVQEGHTPRSYIVDTPKSVIRRNRHHLVADPMQSPVCTEDNMSRSPSVIPTEIGEPVMNKTSRDSTMDTSHTPASTPSRPGVTRSGRFVKIPKKLDL